MSETFVEPIDRVKKFIEDNIKPHLNFDDTPAHISSNPDKFEDIKNTQSLTVFALSLLSNIDINLCKNSVVDSYGDNGIDGIFYDSSKKNLYLITSKFFKNNDKSIERGDILKFKEGIEKLLAEKYDEFNEKVKDKESEVSAAISDDETKIHLVIASTGKSPGDSSLEPLSDYIKELNDNMSDEQWIFIVPYSLKDIVSDISKIELSKEIKLEIGLTNYGINTDPYTTVYGQVSVSEIYDWYDNYGKFIFSENIRGFLGLNDSAVNPKIQETLKNNPQNLFYLNNGITAICDKVKKTPKYGSDTKQGEFICTNIKIVNGAQTVGTIGKTYSNLEDIQGNPKVFIKIISLQNTPSNMGQKITIASNSQNRIDSKDFASMEQNQIRLEQELRKKGGIQYLRLRTEKADPNSISMEQAADALCCYTDDLQICINHKREKGKIWVNLETKPYKNIFNDATTPHQVANAVTIMKGFDEFIAAKKIKKRTNEYAFSTSGDALILHLTFQLLSNKHRIVNGDPANLSKFMTEEIEPLFEKIYSQLLAHITTKYKKAILSRLLINYTKVKEIKEEFMPKFKV